MHLLALLSLFWPRAAVVASDMFVVNAVDPMLIVVIPINRLPSVEFAVNFGIGNVQLNSFRSHRNYSLNQLTV